MAHPSQSFAKFVGEDWFSNGVEPVDLINFWKEFGCDPTSLFHKEGYWSGFATPKTGVVYSVQPGWPKEEAESFAGALTQVEQYLRKRGFLRTMGRRTKCRFCRESVSTVEFYWNGMKWPESYKHYVAEHRLKPSEGFVAQVQSLASRLPVSAEAP